jgi:hypothetical protein
MISTAARLGAESNCRKTPTVWPDAVPPDKTAAIASRDSGSISGS